MTTLAKRAEEARKVSEAAKNIALHHRACVLETAAQIVANHIYLLSPTRQSKAERAKLIQGAMDALAEVGIGFTEPPKWMRMNPVSENNPSGPAVDIKGNGESA